MHRIHAGFTMASAVISGHSEVLKDLLVNINTAPATLVNFNNTPSLLFISGVVLPAQDYLPNTAPETLPETLVLATSYCGPLDNHLAELVQHSAHALVRIFQHCIDFDKNIKANDKAALIEYLQSHKLHSAFNSRYTCITKEDVRREKCLRNEIESYIDSANQLKAFNFLSPEQIRTLIQRHILTRGDDYEWAHKAAEPKSLREMVATNHLTTVVLLVIGFWGIFYLLWPDYFCKSLFIFFLLLVVVAVLVALTMWYIGKQKNDTVPRPPDEHVREVAATQLHPVLNEMTAAGPLKPGILRKYFYAATLRVIGFVATSFMTVPTVSSIRWLVTDNKKRLLFLSNYSNSTDFYVRDFLNGGTPRGVNLMFTNGMGFPDAKFLVKGGISDDPEGFMNAVHAGQHVTSLWYAHEKNLTVDIINKNREIRNGLFKPMNEDETKKWLTLL